MFLALLFLVPGIAAQRDNAPKRQVSFASLVAGLSERPGYFDTDEFIANLRRLPRQPGAVIVRSVFRSGGSSRVAGYNSASLTQPIDALIDGYASGRFRDYRDLTR